MPQFHNAPSLFSEELLPGRLKVIFRNGRDNRPGTWVYVRTLLPLEKTLSLGTAISPSEPRTSCVLGTPDLRAHSFITASTAQWVKYSQEILLQRNNPALLQIPEEIPDLAETLARYLDWKIQTSQSNLIKQRYAIGMSVRNRRETRQDPISNTLREFHD